MSGKRAKKRPRADVPLAQRLGASTPAAPAPEGSVLPGERAASRTEERRRRKQVGRRRTWSVVAVLVVGAVVAAAAFWWASRDSSPDAGPAAPQRTERTVTMVLAEDQGPVLDGVLLVTDPVAASGAGLLVQNRLFVDGVASSAVPFAETTLIGDLGTPGAALAATLDVLVDGTWQLTPDGLATLVDAIGPITVDVDVEVLGRTGEGEQVVVLPAGQDQQVDGAAAVAFATYRAPGEPEEARLARFSQVLAELLSELPTSAVDVTAALDGLGEQSRTTLSTAELADVLVSLGDVVRDDDIRLQSLPVIPIETGGPIESSALDETTFAGVRDTVLAGSIPPEQAGGPVRVLVENGVGTPGIEQDAARLLRKAGFVFVNGGNANRFDYEKTVVIIPDASVEQRELGSSVAAALGVPDSAVRLAPSGQQVAEVIVILGADFDPDGP